MSSLRDKLTEDSIELLGERVIFSDGLQRLEYYQEFVNLYKTSNLRDFECSSGKFFNLREMTEFLAIMTQAAKRKYQPPYVTEKDHEEKLNIIQKTTTFDTWTAQNWKVYRIFLNKIQKNMMRCDADASVHDILANRGDNDDGRRVDQVRSEDPWFTEHLLYVLNLFTFHEKFAPFRPVLEGKCCVENQEQDDDDDMSGDGSDLEHEPFSKKFMDAYMQVVENEKEGPVKSAFLKFLNRDEMFFRSPAAIRRLLENPKKIMSYSFLLRRLNNLIRHWVLKVFERPKLSQIYVSNIIEETIEAEAEAEATTAISAADRAKALQMLKKSRARLNDRVQDPLPDVVVAATRAKRKRPKQVYQSHDESKGFRLSPKARGRLLEKKKTATSLQFTQDEEKRNCDDSTEESDKDVLPKLKKRAYAAASPASVQKKKKSQQKSYDGRRAWSEVEKNAVIEGIQNFGVGKWAVIKKENVVVLRERTSGQIKDCFRTMKNRGELDDVKEAWPEQEKGDNGENERVDEDRENESDE